MTLGAIIFLLVCVTAVGLTAWMFHRDTGYDWITLQPPEKAKHYVINKILNRYQDEGD